MTSAGASGPQDGSALLHRIVVYAPASVVPAVVTLLTSVIFTRIFDADQFGLFSLALVVANIARRPSPSGWSRASGNSRHPNSKPRVVPG